MTAERDEADALRLKVHEFIRRKMGLPDDASQSADSYFIVMGNYDSEDFSISDLYVLDVAASLLVPKKPGGLKLSVYFSERKRFKQ